MADFTGESAVAECRDGLDAARLTTVLFCKNRLAYVSSRDIDLDNIEVDRTEDLTCTSIFGDGTPDDWSCVATLEPVHRPCTFLPSRYRQ